MDGFTDTNRWDLANDRMMHRNARPPWLAVCLAGMVACGGAGEEVAREAGSEMATGAGAATQCDESAARTTVENFGEALARVSLLAPDSLIAQQVRSEYAQFVTPALLELRTTNPAPAPGREVSSPWPHEIEISTVEPAGEGACLIEGHVVYVTSTERTRDESAARVPVTLRVIEAGGWKIDSYQEERPFEPGELPDIAEAADVIHRYYEAVNAGDYATAYALWGDNGAASGQEFADFAAGFAETARVAVEVGEPGRVEPAAGSRYVTIPVVIRATTTAGEEQRFEGTYTLRQSVVDGATAQQRAWHIYSADIRRVQ